MTRRVSRRFTVIWRIIILAVAVFCGWINFRNHIIPGVIEVAFLAVCFLLTLTWNRNRK